MAQPTDKTPDHPPPPALMTQATTRGYAVALSVVALALLMLHGCTTPMRQNAVPQAWTRQATIPGMPTVRYRIPEEVPAVIEAAKASAVREQAYLTQRGSARRRWWPSWRSQAAVTMAPSGRACSTAGRRPGPGPSSSS